MKNNLVEFINIQKSFKTDFWKPQINVLNDLSFSIPQNKIVGFLGANGSGKTTSMKILMGFIKKNSGTVNYSPVLGDTKKDIFRNIGFLPERPYISSILTGMEFIIYMAQLTGLNIDKKLFQDIEKFSEMFSIGHALQRKTSTYSKGMLQRLGFVATLIHDPKLIILDEPLSGLDPLGRKELKDAIIDLYKIGKTIFFSSHIVSDVEDICEDVIFIENGSLVYEGSVDKIIQQHKSDHCELIIQTENDSFLDPSLINFRRDNLIHIVLNESDVADFISKNHNNLILKSMKPGHSTLENILYKIKAGNTLEKYN